ncbi:hypothetical protein K438DRAFT_1602361, partial [Mycena galopus ATCC 62051]
VVRDTLNCELTINHARKLSTAMYDCHAHDFFNTLPLHEDLQTRTWQVRSSNTKDTLGKLPLSIGMKVMVTENIALKTSIVNGAEGILREISYSTDRKGRRYADCAYVEIRGSNVNLNALGPDIIPIVAVPSRFPYTAESGIKYYIGQTQLPLVPAYAYTDYKSQGKSLTWAIIDLTGAHSLQSLYVMISRATSLKLLAVLSHPNHCLADLVPSSDQSFNNWSILTP